MDVRVERVIPLPPDRVARYAMDWRREPEWTQGIRSSEMSAEGYSGGFGAGAEVTRTSYFLGLRIDYVFQVIAHEPPAMLEMKSISGAFPMNVTYRFDEHPDGTLASIQLQGEPMGQYRWWGPMLGWVIRWHIRRDLRDLARNLDAERFEDPD